MSRGKSTRNRTTTAAAATTKTVGELDGRRARRQSQMQTRDTGPVISHRGAVASHSDGRYGEGSCTETRGNRLGPAHRTQRLIRTPPLVSTA